MKKREIVLWVWLIILSIITFNLSNENLESSKKIDTLSHNVSILEKRITKIESSTKKVEYTQNSFMNLTTKEFENTWRSLARMRNNFMALGTGYHLDDKDIMGGNESAYDVDNDEDEKTGTD